MFYAILYKDKDTLINFELGNNSTSKEDIKKVLLSLMRVDILKKYPKKFAKMTPDELALFLDFVIGESEEKFPQWV